MVCHSEHAPTSNENYMTKNHLFLNLKMKTPCEMHSRGEIKNDLIIEMLMSKSQTNSVFFLLSGLCCQSAGHASHCF